MNRSLLKINISLLVIFFTVFLYLPLSDNSISHAHNKKNTNELNDLIESIQTNITKIQANIDLLNTDMQANKEYVSDNQPTKEYSGEELKSKISLLEDALKAIDTSISSVKQNSSQQQNTTEGLNNQLKIIDQNFKDTLTLLDEKELKINKNHKSIEEIQEDLEKTYRNIRTNSADANIQKSLIEGNSTRIYEVLINLVKAQQDIEKLDNEILRNLSKITKAAEQEPLDLTKEINQLWEIINIILIFFIPLAFSYAYTGHDRLKDGVTISDGMILTLFGTFLGYMTIGFGIMYGNTLGGFIGFDSPFFKVIMEETDIATQAKVSEFMLYQSGTVILACLIIYSAIGTQLSSVNHFLLATLAGAIFVPLFSHWTFAGRFIEGNTGWMQAFGYSDGVGSTSVSLVPAFMAITILYLLRKVEPNSFTSTDVSVYSSSSILLLFIGWIGLTTGHLPINDAHIVLIILNVAVAAVTASIVSLVQRLIFSTEKNRITYALGGFVSGLVAIAACGDSITLIEAFVVGAIAGSIHNIGFAFFRNTIFTQPWQNRSIHLASIHGLSSIWGILCVALLGTQGSFNLPNLTIFATQIQGIGIAIVYAIVAGIISSILIGRGLSEKNPDVEKLVQ